MRLYQNTSHLKTWKSSKELEWWHTRYYAKCCSENQKTKQFLLLQFYSLSLEDKGSFITITPKNFIVGFFCIFFNFPELKKINEHHPVQLLVYPTRGGSKGSASGASAKSGGGTATSNLGLCTFISAFKPSDYSGLTWPLRLWMSKWQEFWISGYFIKGGFPGKHTDSLSFVIRIGRSHSSAKSVKRVAIYHMLFIT